MMRKKAGRMSFGRYDYAAFTSFSGYAACSMAVAVALVDIGRDLGFPLDRGGMTAGGVLHAIRSAAMVGSMLFCGAAAGHWGLRRSLGVSVALMGFGILLCAAAPWYWLLLSALTVAGCGEGAIEGLATPFVQKLHEKREPGRYINFTHGFWSAGVGLTVILAGLAISGGMHGGSRETAARAWFGGGGGISWRIVFAVIGGLAAIPACLLLWREKPAERYPEEAEKSSPGKVFTQSVAILKRPLFWLFFAAMFFAGGGEFGLTFWCASFVRLTVRDAAWLGGFVTAVFALGMFLGRTGSGLFVRQRNLKFLIVAAALSGAVVSSLVPLVRKEYFASEWTLLATLSALFLAGGLAAAPFWPSVQSYCCDRMPEVDSTMLFILLSCAGIPGCGFVTWLIGYIGDKPGFGLRVSFFVIPVCFLILALLIVLDMFIAPRKKTDVRHESV